MNISLTCCVSLVGFDWGPNPSLRCMNVGLNIHQMLSEKLYPLLSTTHKDTNRPPHKPEELSQELNSSPGLTCCLPELFQRALRWCLRVVLCHAGIWMRLGGQHRSIPYICHIHLPYCYCLQVPPQPFNPRRTTSAAVRSLRVSLRLLTRTLWGSPPGPFWCTVHHTCFNHSVSQTPPGRRLLQHITEYTQLVI